MTAAVLRSLELPGSRRARIADERGARPAARLAAAQAFEAVEAPPSTVDLTLLSCISSVKQEEMQEWVALWGAWVKPQA